MAKIGDILEFKDGSARVKVLKLEPDQGMNERVWVEVYNVTPGGKYSFLNLGSEGYIELDGNWLVVPMKTPSKTQKALGIEGPSYNQRGARQ